MQVCDTGSVEDSRVWEVDEVGFILHQVTLGRTEPLRVRQLCELLAFGYHAIDQATGTGMLERPS